MCGIVFVHNKNGNRANKSVRKRFVKQRSRGSEGFGYLSITKDGYMSSFVRAAEEANIQKQLGNELCPTIMFHHRFPTSTPNLAETAHPIEVSSELLKYRYFVVHNGIIQNDDDLKKRHAQKGFTYNTLGQKMIKTATKKHILNYFYNDSECLAIELAVAIENNKTSIELTGSVAFVMAQVDKKTDKIVNIFFGRNAGSPLKMENGNDIFSVCSESSASGAIEIVENTLYSFDLKTAKVSVRPFLLGTAITYLDEIDAADRESGMGFQPYKKGGSVGIYGGYRGDLDEYGNYDEFSEVDLPPNIISVCNKIVVGNKPITENEYNHLVLAHSEAAKEVGDLEIRLENAITENDYDKEEGVRSLLDRKSEAFTYLEEMLYSVSSVLNKNGKVKKIATKKGYDD